MITLLFDMEVDMADTIKDNRFTIDEDGSSGYIQIADDVVSSIIGLAVTEVDGVSKLTGDITRDLVAKLGKNSLSRASELYLTMRKTLRFMCP